MMKYTGLLTALLLTAIASPAQKVVRFEFNLYTDSLKKGFYNYINIDGELSGGEWRPLDSSSVRLSANTGRFRGNDLFIDSSYHGDSVCIKATLKSDPKIYRETTIYIRRRGFGALPSEREVMDKRRKQ